MSTIFLKSKNNYVYMKINIHTDFSQSYLPYFCFYCSSLNLLILSIYFYYLYIFYCIKYIYLLIVFSDAILLESSFLFKFYVTRSNISSATLFSLFCACYVILSSLDLSNLYYSFSFQFSSFFNSLILYYNAFNIIPT